MTETFQTFTTFGGTGGGREGGDLFTVPGMFFELLWGQGKSIFCKSFHRCDNLISSGRRNNFFSKIDYFPSRYNPNKIPKNSLESGFGSKIGGGVGI